MNVLIVTENRTVTSDVRAALASATINFMLLDNFVDAHKHVSHPLLDVLVIDLDYPDDAGYTFLQRMRQTGQLMDLPIVGIIESPVDVKQAIEAGINRYVTQAFVKHNLMQTLLTTRV